MFIFTNAYGLMKNENSPKNVDIQSNLINLIINWLFQLYTFITQLNYLFTTVYKLDVIHRNRISSYSNRSRYYWIESLWQCRFYWDADKWFKLNVLKINRYHNQKKKREKIEKRTILFHCYLVHCQLHWLTSIHNFNLQNFSLHWTTTPHWQSYIVLN